jgi:hypothetical protein
VNTIQFFTDKNCFGACDPMDVLHRPVGADLFEIQMFLVDIGNGQKAWYGSLQSMNDEKKHYFKGWSGLVANLQGILTPVAQLGVLEAFLSRRRLEDKVIHGST